MLLWKSAAGVGARNADAHALYLLVCVKAAQCFIQCCVWQNGSKQVLIYNNGVWNNLGENYYENNLLKWSSPSVNTSNTL